MVLASCMPFFCNTEKFHQDYAPRLPVSKGLILQLEKCWRTMRCIPPNRSNIHVYLHNCITINVHILFYVYMRYILWVFFVSDY